LQSIPLEIPVQNDLHRYSMQVKRRREKNANVKGPTRCLFVGRCM